MLKKHNRAKGLKNVITCMTSFMDDPWAADKKLSSQVSVEGCILIREIFIGTMNVKLHNFNFEINWKSFLELRNCSSSSSSYLDVWREKNERKVLFK